MATQKDELVEKTKAKIIELFRPESALAQAMEDDDFFRKLGDLVSWLFGEIMLSQPKPEPRPSFPEHPWPQLPKHPLDPELWTDRTKWRRTTWSTPGDFTYKVTSAMTKWADAWKSSLTE